MMMLNRGGGNQIANPNTGLQRGGNPMGQGLQQGLAFKSNMLRIKQQQQALAEGKQREDYNNSANQLMSLNVQRAQTEAQNNQFSAKYMSARTSGDTKTVAAMTQQNPGLANTLDAHLITTSANSVAAKSKIVSDTFGSLPDAKTYAQAYPQLVKQYPQMHWADPASVQTDSEYSNYKNSLLYSMGVLNRNAPQVVRLTDAAQHGSAAERAAAQHQLQVINQDNAAQARNLNLEGNYRSLAANNEKLRGQILQKQLTGQMKKDIPTGEEAYTGFQGALENDPYYSKLGQSTYTTIPGTNKVIKQPGDMDVASQYVMATYQKDINAQGSNPDANLARQQALASAAERTQVGVSIGKDGRLMPTGNVHFSISKLTGRPGSDGVTFTDQQLISSMQARLQYVKEYGALPYSVLQTISAQNQK